MTRIKLPFPPSVNGYWRAIVRGKHATQIISKKGREYRENAIKECQARGVSNSLLKGRLKVLLQLHPPDHRLTDLDNYTKAALDALTHAGVWVDDQQIDDLRIVRMDNVKGGNIVVTINEIDT